MSWLFSQALVEEYSVDTSLDGELSVPLSGNPTQQAYCVPDKMTVFCRLFRFGMTYKPLTENRGEELLTLYRAGFHAKTYQQPEKAQELTENDQECGATWRGWLAKYDPDSSLWRTAQCSLLEDLEPFLETWPQWGLMRDGECWEQQTLAQTTSATESGSLLPTPTMQGLNGGSNSRKSAIAKGNWPPHSYWATPATSDGQRGGTITDKMTGQSLPQMVNTPAKWPTPTVQDSEQAGGKGCIASGKRGLSLHQATQLWPSPNARDWKDSGASQGNRKFPNLGTQVHWPTPRSCSAMAATLTDQSQRFPNLETVMAHTDQATIGGKLNPDWVEWLMNWPIKWSNLNGFNKQEFQRWQEASAKAIQNAGQMRTMWWDSDPSQTPLGQQPVEQSRQQHSDSLPEMPRDASCERKMERSQQKSDLSLLREDVYIQQTKGKNLQSGMWEQTGLDKAEVIPRVSQLIVARVDRLKAIGNGQVPLCAATAWRILNELF